MVEKKRSRAGEALMALALMAASCGAAQAEGGPVSSVATATASAVFAKAGSVTVSIKTKALLAGNIADNTSIGSIDVAGGAGQIVAYRWTPGTGDINAASTGVPIIYTVTGKEGNKISIKTYLNGESTQTRDDNGPWISTADKSNNISLDVRMNNAQFLKPDTYTLSVDGAVWAS